MLFKWTPGRMSGVGVSWCWVRVGCLCDNERREAAKAAKYARTTLDADTEAHKGDDDMKLCSFTECQRVLRKALRKA